LSLAASRPQRTTERDRSDAPGRQIRCLPLHSMTPRSYCRVHYIHAMYYSQYDVRSLFSLLLPLSAVMVVVSRFHAVQGFVAIPATGQASTAHPSRCGGDMMMSDNHSWNTMSARSAPSRAMMLTRRTRGTYDTCLYTGPSMFGQHQPDAASLRPMYAVARHVLLAARSSSETSSSTATNKWRRIMKNHQPLQRPHEVAIFAFYGAAGTISNVVALSKGYTYYTHANSKIDAAICLVWSSFVMAISFMEAWVKFKAPFLRRHIALDVGRHVFAALNAAELGLATSFWFGRLVLNVLSRQDGRKLLDCSATQSLLPAVATAILLLEAFYIAPKLYIRAKAQIVEGFDGVSNDDMTTAEQSTIVTLRDDAVNKSQKIPSSKWHFVYVLLELIKVLCLNIFVSSL